MGKVRVEGLPVHLSETDWEITSASPCLGQDTDDVLVNLLGVAPDDLVALREAGVI
jgi:crotonobetainyl-CoA:carnitine CoA-transferase CaiB-like acyl-CoA transferase